MNVASACSAPRRFQAGFLREGVSKWHWLLAVLLPVVGDASAGDLEPALQLYYDRQMEEAAAALQEFVADDPTDFEAAAWAAEAHRRAGNRDEAERYANWALGAAECSSMAHLVLGELFNPQYGGWGGRADPETAWAHYQHAAKCDPDDGNVWFSIWSMAIKRDDEESARRALAQLRESGLVTPAALVMARWVLTGLPSDAVLFVNGDMDTYPELVAQQTESLRPDVCLINVNLLNAEWYAAHISRTCDLPLPEQTLEYIPNADGSFVDIGSQLVKWWVERASEGNVVRPLAFATTLPDLGRFDLTADSLVAGGAFLLLPTGNSGPDLDAMAAALATVDLETLAQPLGSPRDYSPSRRSSEGLKNNVVMAAYILGTLHARRGEVEAAQTWSAWLEDGARYFPDPDRVREGANRIAEMLDE